MSILPSCAAQCRVTALLLWIHCITLVVQQQRLAASGSPNNPMPRTSANFKYCKSCYPSSNLYNELNEHTNHILLLRAVSKLPACHSTANVKTHCPNSRAFIHCISSTHPIVVRHSGHPPDSERPRKRQAIESKRYSYGLCSTLARMSKHLSTGNVL